MTAATLPFPGSSPKSRPWTPSDRERMIFQWVKFDGHTQAWVGQQLGMHQTTVSRIVERYERWIARGGPTQEGGLSHEERVRAQRWLTYERNEWIIASALRLAGEMERAIDTAKSNITHHASQPSKEILVRTEHAVLDRSGIANRYLRLAHRVGMDQLKLLEKEPLPPLEPLTFEDVACGEDEGLAVANVGAPGPGAPAPREESGTPRELHTQMREQENGHEPLCASAPLRENEGERVTPPSGASPMHGMHNEPAAESISSQVATETCGDNPASKKSADDAYAVVDNPPEIVDCQSSPDRWLPTCETVIGSVQPITDC